MKTVELLILVGLPEPYLTFKGFKSKAKQTFAHEINVKNQPVLSCYHAGIQVMTGQLQESIACPECVCVCVF